MELVVELAEARDRACDGGGGRRGKMEGGRWEKMESVIELLEAMSEGPWLRETTRVAAVLQRGRGGPR